ncbi:MAG: endonuclease/exonuclease/phosphatase family protein [Peptostreptococcaceae bacterium]
MKLLTLNCHSWQEDNQIEKIKYLAKVINEKEYDVIALQEVSQLINSDIVFGKIKKDNFALLLKEELLKLNNKYEFVWDSAHIGYDIYEEGLCIMTKLPIIEHNSFYVSNSNEMNFWKSRKVVKVKIKYKEKYIVFYSCHLGWWNDEDEPFKVQVRNLVDDVEKEDFALVMGDFNNNACLRNEGYDYLLKAGLVDTYNLAKVKDYGFTVKGKIAGWDNNKDDLRLDIIFSNKELEIENSNVIFNGKNKKVISDHFGVEVEINI